MVLCQRQITKTPSCGSHHIRAGYPRGIASIEVLKALLTSRISALREQSLQPVPQQHLPPYRTPAREPTRRQIREAAEEAIGPLSRHNRSARLFSALCDGVRPEAAGPLHFEVVEFCGILRVCARKGRILHRIRIERRNPLAPNCALDICQESVAALLCMHSRNYLGDGPPNAPFFTPLPRSFHRKTQDGDLCAGGPSAERGSGTALARWALQLLRGSAVLLVRLLVSGTPLFPRFFVQIWTQTRFTCDFSCICESLGAGTEAEAV
eukprot:scaffold4030_cov263-Pinguiococcus_pyrenoidosus.AAC.2